MTAFEGVISFLDTVEDRLRRTYSYVPNGKPSARAAVLGSVCRQFLGWKKEDLRDTVVAALKEVGEPTCNRDDSDVLTNYFGTLAAYQQGGEIWENWNEMQKKNLVEGQIKEGPWAGSWAPKGVWGGGGHILSTTLCTLSLEVYYRYLPVYK